MSEYGPRPEYKEPTKPAEPKRPTSEFNASGMPLWETKREPKSPTPTPAPWEKRATPPPFPKTERPSETPEQAQARLEKGKQALDRAKKTFMELNHQAEILRAKIESLKNRKLLALPQQVKRLKAEVHNLVETEYHQFVNSVKLSSRYLHTEDRGGFTKLIEEIETKYRSLKIVMHAQLEEIEKGSAINRVARWFKRDS